MPRIARIVVPHYPHHVTQRGNRSQTVFFNDGDYAAYLGLLREAISKSSLRIWAYCLMPNHIHLIAVPETPESLRQLFSQVHLKYTRRINTREGWRGHLWQERFHSFVMDEPHLLSAARYIELNPVRAGLCRLAEDWRWSSVHAHIKGTNNGIVSVEPLLQIVADWRAYLSNEPDSDPGNQIHRHSNTGRPLGGESFIDKVQSLTGRDLKRKTRGTVTF